MRTLSRLVVFRRPKGFTVAEMMIAVAVSSLMLAFLAYLTWFTGRNFFTLHEQLLSQTTAAAAQERLVKIARNAVGFEKFSGDTSSTVKRIKIKIPATASTTDTYVAAYDEVSRSLKIFTSEDGLTFPGSSVASTSAPAWEFGNLENTEFTYETSFRITVTTGFSYRGSAGYAPNNPQYGRFTTDIIAKNHYLDQGVNSYALDLGTSGPATL